MSSKSNNILYYSFIISGVILLCISLILIPLGEIIENKNNEMAELKESQYMQENYGYKDNMDEYLDYLKANDFDEYMNLKAVFDEIHSYEHTGTTYITIAFPLVLVSLFCILLGVVYKSGV